MRNQDAPKQTVHSSSLRSRCPPNAQGFTASLSPKRINLPPQMQDSNPRGSPAVISRTQSYNAWTSGLHRALEIAITAALLRQAVWLSRTEFSAPLCLQSGTVTVGHPIAKLCPPGPPHGRTLHRRRPEARALVSHRDRLQRYPRIGRRILGAGGACRTQSHRSGHHAGQKHQRSDLPPRRSVPPDLERPHPCSIDSFKDASVDSGGTPASCP